MKNILLKDWVEKAEEARACKKAVEWLKDSPEATVKTIVKKDYQWLLWAVQKIKGFAKAIGWTKRENAKLSVFCAELVLSNWEKEYPDDDRPRQAIESAKRWLNEPTEENKRKAASAAAALAAASASASAAALASASAATLAAALASASAATLAAASASAAASAMEVVLATKSARKKIVAIVNMINV